MKTITPLVMLLVLANTLVQAQQLPNAGFEIWSHKSIADPSGFFTSNAMIASGSGNVTKVSDAFHGVSAVKLETVVSGKDTIQGMLVIGTPGDHGITGGIPFSSPPDSVSCYVKYNVLPTDTAHFIVAFKKNGNYTGQAQCIFTGTQTTYKRVSIPTYLSPLNPPDSLVAIITSSNMDPPRKPGSTLTIDSISFIHSAQQFPNADFENWSTLNGPDDPTAWGTYAGQYPTYNIPVLVTKTADSHSGSFAVKLISDTGYVQPPFGKGLHGEVLAGTLQLNLINGYMSTKYPFAFRPDSITGYAKGTVAAGSNNMNLVWVQLSNSGNVIGQGFYAMTSSLANYVRFTTPINYSSALAPDSIIFALIAGNPGGTYYPGNSFYVDDLAFIYKVTTPNYTQVETSVLVLVGKDYLSVFSDKSGKMTIYTTSGKVIAEQGIPQSKSYIYIDKLPRGFYLYRLISPDGITFKNGKFIK